MSETAPMGSPTTYPKSGACSKHAIKEDVKASGSWQAGTGTSYPLKNHQRINNREIIVKGMDYGKKADSSYTYPDKDWQRKFGAVKKQV